MFYELDIIYQIHTYTFSQTSIDTRYIDIFVHTNVLIHSHDNYMKVTIHYRSTQHTLKLIHVLYTLEYLNSLF